MPVGISFPDLYVGADGAQTPKHGDHRHWAGPRGQVMAQANVHVLLFSHRIY